MAWVPAFAGMTGIEVIARVPLCTAFDSVTAAIHGATHRLRVALPGHPWPVV